MKDEKISIGYVRVSTDEQRDRGYSLEQQEHIIRKYFEATFPLSSNLKFINDGGYSALSLKRPGIQQIMRLAELNLIDRVIFLEQDRLIREPIDGYYLMDLFKNNDVEVCCVFGEINIDTADGEFEFGLRSILSKRESKKTSERTKRGLDGKARNNLYPYSNLPFGISRNKEDGTLYYNEDINVVKDIYDLYVNKHLSSFDVHKAIHDKYPNVVMNLKYGYLTRLLKNSLYRGFFTRTTQSKEVIVVQVIDPLFTEDDIDKIDKVYTKYKMKSIYKYALRNKVFFEDGRKMRHCTKFKTNSNGSRVKYIYYYSKEHGIYINEKQILKKLKIMLKKNEAERNNNISKKLHNLDEMFINNDITVEQYKSMLKKLNKGVDLKNQFKKVVVNKSKNIEILF